MPPHDIVLYGATGFVGQLVAEYLARHPETRAASLGRSPDATRDKLQCTAKLVGRTRLPRSSSRTHPTSAAIDAMVSQARVVVTTAGPYAEYGGRGGRRGVREAGPFTTRTSRASIGFSGR